MIVMNIDGFIWLPDIVDKLAVKHHVTQNEVEEIFFNHPKYRFTESGIIRLKMFMPRLVKQTQVVT